MAQGKKASDYKRKPVARNAKPGPSFGVAWMMAPELVSDSPNLATPAYSLGVNNG